MEKVQKPPRKAAVKKDPLISLTVGQKLQQDNKALRAQVKELKQELVSVPPQVTLSEQLMSVSEVPQLDSVTRGIVLRLLQRLASLTGN